MKSLIEQVDKLAVSSGFSGVVSLSKHGKSLYERAFGLADRKNDVRNSLSTQFGIASGTKFITALGIGKLIDRNMLTLETQIGEIFDRDLGYVDSTATIRNLLTHTSGIFDYLDEEIVPDENDFFTGIPWYRLETPSDYLPLFEGQKPKFKPDERASYSNGGYVFLGVLIEFLTHKLYRDFISEEILKPSGMDNSGFYPFNDLPEKAAYGYIEKDGKFLANIYNLPIRGGGDGGMYSTVRDIAGLWEGFFSGKILSEKLLGQYITPAVILWEKIDYGLGLYIKPIGGRKFHYLVGCDAGVGFRAGYDTVNKLCITIMSNHTDGGNDIWDLFIKNIDTWYL
ncbi:MAG: beta-lactamase family protein [Spirochaetales bacterium]|nr:beta-lactamase family protein [Spirochaetales bacterium]